MPTFKDMNSLMAYVQKMAMETLQSDVVPVVKEEYKKHIQSDVYDVYDPKRYDRRNSLLDDNNILSEQVDQNTISITDIAEPNTSVKGTDNSGKQLMWWIEEGLIYPLAGGGVWSEARPATANTVEDLKSTEKHVQAMKQGLRKKGIMTK